MKTVKPTTTTIGLTWEVWNKDYPSVGFRGWINSLIEPMYGDSVFPKTINTMMTTYDKYYTYAVVIKKEDFLNRDGKFDMYYEKGYINNIVATGSASTIEEAKTKQSKQVQRVQRTSLHHRRRLSKSLVLLTVGATGIAC